MCMQIVVRDERCSLHSIVFNISETPAVRTLVDLGPCCRRTRARVLPAQRETTDMGERERTHVSRTLEHKRQESVTPVCAEPEGLHGATPPATTFSQAHATPGPAPTPKKKITAWVCARVCDARCPWAISRDRSPRAPSVALGLASSAHRHNNGLSISVGPIKRQTSAVVEFARPL